MRKCKTSSPAAFVETNANAPKSASGESGAASLRGGGARSCPHMQRGRAAGRERVESSVVAG